MRNTLKSCILKISMRDTPDINSLIIFFNNIILLYFNGIRYFKS
jgi:hypothetical protein